MVTTPRCGSVRRALMQLHVNPAHSSRRFHGLIRQPSAIRVSQERSLGVRSVLPRASFRLRCTSGSAKYVSQCSTEAENYESKSENGNASTSIKFDLPLAGYVDLSPQRGLIEVTGLDAFRFLHGLLTNEPPSGHEGVYATFLNVRGRIMYDVFIYPALHNKKWVSENPVEDPESETYLIEHDVHVTDQLYKYLTFRKLREKVKLRKVTDWKVWFAWEDDPRNLLMRRTRRMPTKYDSDPYLRKTPPFIGANDARAPGFGVRMVLSNNAESPLWPLRVYEEGRVESFVYADIATYNVRRIMYGIPEGTQEFSPGDMLPMESCVDMMGGINFDKGCYVGQELTTRAKRVGITKRRMVPYMIYDLASDKIPSGIEYNPDFELPEGITLPYKSPIIAANTQPKINSRGEVARSVGKLISRTANVGLASVALDWIDNGEEVERCRLVPSDINGALTLDDLASGVKTRGIGIKFFRPYWWHDADKVFVPPAKEEPEVNAETDSNASNAL
ncbi:hypothetical protein V1520DRAFT_211107 [Lipomyces starkeyi]|uniref:Uncharacterized protein n=1 Tax=Lipomyces starkeyi NRRL Y-11557 TaxID=675824 RepID=A0A1E3QDM7_LIPST|nr:hypothetical protein LIPSTDRAFT_109351 [Lipomyces starkeyi NRRL Y-11557]